MTNRQERIIYGLMAANAAVFAVIFLWVSSNYRLAADDLHYLVKTNELGIWDSMLFYYQNWNPRWSATLVTNSVLTVAESPMVPFSYFLLTLAFGVAAIWAMVRAVVNQLKLPIGSIRQGIFSAYLLAALFYGSFSKDDTWFWITVNPMYLWGSFAAILGGSFIIGKRASFLQLLLIVVLFVYAGGASETVAISTVIVLFFLGFITHKKQFQILVDRRALHLATIACLVGFAIDVLGPGAHVRFEHLPQFSLTERAIVGFWNYAKFALMEVPIILPALIIAASPLAFFGRKQLRFQLIDPKELMLSNRKLWIVTDILVFIMAFTMAFAMGEMGPKRAWIPIAFIALVFSVVLAYQLGTWVYIRTKGKLFQMVIIAQVVGLVYQIVMGSWQIGITSAYAKAVDERMATIHSQMEVEEIIVLEPLPDSGWLFTAEITTDTAHFTNRHLGLYFGNEHTFVLQDTVTSSE